MPRLMTHSLKIARLAEVYPRADRVLNRNSRIVLFPHLPAVATFPANCAPGVGSYRVGFNMSFCSAARIICNRKYTDWDLFDAFALTDFAVLAVFRSSGKASSSTIVSRQFTKQH